MKAFRSFVFLSAILPTVALADEKKPDIADLFSQDPLEAAVPLPEADKPDSKPVQSQVFGYRVTKEVTVTPKGPLAEIAGDATVNAAFSASEIRLSWSNGVRMSYKVSGHEPVAERKPDGSEQMVPALRGWRVATSGSIEQVILTVRNLVITSPGSATQNITVTYAAAIELPAIAHSPTPPTQHSLFDLK